MTHVFALLPPISITRTALIEAGLIAPDGAAFVAGPLDVLASAGAGASPVVADGKIEAAAAQVPQVPTRAPCDSCGSTTYTKSRIRRGQTLCLSCARAER
jgi:hypothetical protein